MYINTKSRDEIMTSVLEVLNINSNKLDELLETCYERFQKDHPVFILDNQYDYFFDCVKKHLCKEIDQVLFIHISRRLDDSDISCGLKDVLKQENSFTTFLKEHKITFHFEDRIQLLIDNKEYKYDESKYIDRYLRQRFTLDYDLKGFVFEDSVEKEAYEYVPDIINYLDNIVDISDDYIAKSICYQFIYAVEMDNVYFEGYDELTNQEKQYHIVTKALQYLYFYEYDESFIHDEECFIALF
ncbi:MAG: hypothetical protein EOM50_15655 [Erysipelotrichia bacterium]|nr:hypothetical protein [Erysipelotrichia bacterium]